MISGNYTLYNSVSSKPDNSNIGYNNSWITVTSNADRPLYAQASYITNLDDIAVSLKDSNAKIGIVALGDPDTNLNADVINTWQGLHSLSVKTQPLSSKYDNISIGDPLNRYALVNAATSGLNVYVTNPVTTVTVSSVTNSVKTTVTNTVSAVLMTAVSANVMNMISAVLLEPVTVSNVVSALLMDSISATVLNPITISNVVSAYIVNDLVTLAGSVSAVLLEPVTVSNVVSAYVVNEPIPGSSNLVKDWGILNIILPPSIEIVLPNQEARNVTILNYTGDTINLKKTTQDVYIPIFNTMTLDVSLMGNLNEATLFQTNVNELTAQVKYTQYI